MDGVPQWISGVASRQAHVGLPPGTVEEEHGRSGSSDRRATCTDCTPRPTGWTSTDRPPTTRTTPGCSLAATTSGRRSSWATTSSRSPGTATKRVAPSSSVTPTATASSSSTRGPGACTEYGPLDYGPGDYLVVPRGTTYRFEPATPTDLLVVEACESRFQLPDKGLLGRHALFDPAAIEVPEAEAIDEAGEFTVVVKRLGQDTRVTYPFHPCDVVGWKGDVAPMRINVADFRPVTSARYHLPRRRTRPSSPTASSSAPSPLVRSRTIRRPCDCRSSTATSTTTRSSCTTEASSRPGPGRGRDADLAPVRPPPRTPAGGPRA